MYTVCTPIIDQTSHLAVSLEIFGLNMVWQVPGGANVIEAYNLIIIEYRPMAFHHVQCLKKRTMP